MFVYKRDGRREGVRFDAIIERLQPLAEGLSAEFVDVIEVAQKVIAGLYPGVSTSKIDELAAETAAALMPKHVDYGILAARIAITNLHKNTHDRFSDAMRDLYEWVDKRTGQHRPCIARDFWETVSAHKARLDAAVVTNRDFLFDFFGFKTLERSYLMQLEGRVVERPQYLLMRVAVAIHGNDVDAAIETYNLMSLKWFTHASPTLFNAGTPNAQLSSCFLVAMSEDSIEGIYDTLKECAMISRSAGGIGLSVSNIRAKGSSVGGGACFGSSGLVPMLRVFNDTARFVDQGGKRKGAFAIYLEPWHADVYDFLELRKNHGHEEHRARDLFYALWIPDLFMRRVEADSEWSLFCPSEAPGLDDVHGEAFDALYARYEREGRARKVVRAQELWFRVISTQIETGTPYMLYKDACNRKSNQRHLGTIKSSNLCTEIVEYSSKDETAVCNLASIALSMFVSGGDEPACDCSNGFGAAGGAPSPFDPSAPAGAPHEERGPGSPPRSASSSSLSAASCSSSSSSSAPSCDSRPASRPSTPPAPAPPPAASPRPPAFDFERLRQVTRVVTKNLNRIIDRNHYPVEKARRSNMRHRPIGIGVQGLADAFIRMRYPFDSAEAADLNRRIFEAIYFAALEASCELAEAEGPCETHAGSPASEGLLQHDMWGVEAPPDSPWDWAGLRQRIARHGLRNSLLVAPMPTASTSQILGNNECIEPYTSNLYLRRVLAGEFFCVNAHLVRDLSRLGLWSEEIKTQIVIGSGSIQHIPEIPPDLKELYKTVWEIKQRALVDMAADRGAFIDQSQSFNAFMAEPTPQKLTSMHFYAWKRGLKTGMYYLRTKAAADAIKFTVDHDAIKRHQKAGRAAASSSTAAQEARKPGPGEEEGEEEEEGAAGPAPASSAASVSGGSASAAEEAPPRVCSFADRDACLSCGS
eukprot:tig00000733_g3775.t1